MKQTVTTDFSTRTHEALVESMNARLSVPWPSMPVLIPHRIRRKLRSRLRSRQSPASSITSLQTSLSPSDTLRSLRAHQWSYYDGQYIFLALVGVFALCVIQSPGPLVKTSIAALLTLSLLLPITRQFFMPFLPIAAWLVLFYACRLVVITISPPTDSSESFSRSKLTLVSRFVPGDYRPHIWVRVLPALENIFYGANLSNILSAHKHVLLDVLAWLPYGIIHFGAPVVCSAIIFIFAPPGTLPAFAKNFGYMNVTGVIIQLLFPCSPPCMLNGYSNRIHVC